MRVAIPKVRRLLSLTDGALLLVAISLLSLQAVLAQQQSSGNDAPGIDLLGAGILSLASLFAVVTLRLPAVGAIGALTCTLAWYQIGYTSSLINVPHLVAFFLLGLSGDRLRQLAVGGFAVVATIAAMAISSDESTAAIAAAIGGTVAAVLLGEATRHRRAQIVAYASRAERAEAEREAEAQRRVAAARLEIARDLHDVLAHTVSLMTLQASVGLDALQRQTTGAPESLLTIRSAGRDAMREIEALVSVLRGSSQVGDNAPLPRVDRIEELARAARASGLSIELCLSVDGERLSDLTHLTIYRVVQEGLTNVLRHANADAVVIQVHRRGNDIAVEVCDDGRDGSEETQSGGFGLQGMRERIAALGGSLVAGPANGREPPHRGWCVHATIPQCHTRRS